MELDCRKVKYIYTFSLFYCFIACGLCFSIFNPTLIDLSDLFNSSIKDASLVFPIRSSGYVVGALTSGVLFTLFNRQLSLICLLLLKSVTIALVPHYKYVYQFYINGVFNGFFTAGIDTGVNVWVNEMWGATGGPFMQALHFAFGIGSTLGPLLAEPFLSPRNSTEQILSNNSRGFESLGQYKNNLYIPYSISASTAIISAIIFTILFCLCRYKRELSTDEEQLTESNESIQRCPDLKTCWIITISALLLLVYAGMETAYFQFSTTFVTKTDLHLSKSVGAFITSALAGSYTIFRALSILIAIKLKPHLMLYLDCLIIVIATIVLQLFANSNQIMLWTGNILLGIGFASFCPSFYPFIESTIKITDIYGSIFIFSAGLSSAICPLIVGQFIEDNPMVLIYTNMICVILTIIILIVTHITIRIRTKHLINSALSVNSYDQCYDTSCDNEDNKRE